MKTALLVALLLILLAGAIWLLYRKYYVKVRTQRLSRKKYKIVEPLLHKLATIDISAEEEILKLVKEPSLRHSVFRILEKYNRIHLFPADYLTHEKGAEGFLANWLEYPTELGTAPNEMALITKVTLREENEALDYYVFRFQSNAPPWAAQQGWMMGVAGPYRTESKPYDVPSRVFSRFTAVDEGSPQTEAEWVHENVGR